MIPKNERSQFKFGWWLCAILIIVDLYLSNWSFFFVVFCVVLMGGFYEICLEPIKRLLTFIHKEIYFYRDKRKRQLKYQLFKLDVKSNQANNFENRAKDLVK